MFNRLFALFIYTIILSPAIGCTYIAERRKNNALVFWLVSIIAVILPCFLAAYRGITVGVDVEAYAKPVYLLAKDAHTFESLLLLNTRFETGYLAVAFIASHVFASFNAMLFLTHLLIVLPIYLGAFQLREKVPAWATMFCFYAFFYIETFNIMRQGIAVAFIFYSFAFLQNSKWIKALLCVFVSSLFHSSAILGFILIIFAVQFRKIQKKRLKVFLFIVIVVAVPLIMSRWVEILLFFEDRIPLIAFYANKYIRSFRAGSTYFTELFFGNYLELFVRWLGILIPMGIRTIRKKYLVNDLEYSVLIGSLLGVMLYSAVFFLMHSSYGYRLSFYTEILLILWVGSLAQNVTKSSKRFTININMLVMIGCNIGCFLIIYIWRGMHGTLPLYFQIYNF